MRESCEKKSIARLQVSGGFFVIFLLSEGGFRRGGLGRVDDKGLEDWGMG